MDWRAVWEWVQVAQLPVILLLILVDLGLGIAQALRRGFFHWSRVGEFYRTNVLPYAVGYVVLYVAVELARVLEILPLLSGILGDGLPSMAFAVIVYNLGSSIRENVRLLQFVWTTAPAPTTSENDGGGCRRQ